MIECTKSHNFAALLLKSLGEYPDLLLPLVHTIHHAARITLSSKTLIFQHSGLLINVAIKIVI